MTEYADVPDEVLAHLRSCCGALPDTEEEQAWTGRRWVVRRRNFAHVLTVDEGGKVDTILLFRAAEEEREVLLASGHPFFTPGWGATTVGMVLDGATDWEEVGELLTESYCTLAPKKLVALVDRPAGP